MISVYEKRIVLLEHLCLSCEKKKKSEDVTEKRKNLIAIIGSVNGTSFQSSSFSLQSIILQFRIEVFHA
jgi:hypothetical protein